MMIILTDANGWIVAECQAAAAHLGLPALLGNPLVVERRRQIAEFLGAPLPPCVDELLGWRWMTSCIVGRNEWRSRATTGILSAWDPHVLLATRCKYLSVYFSGCDRGRYM